MFKFKILVFELHSQTMNGIHLYCVQPSLYNRMQPSLWREWMTCKFSARFIFHKTRLTRTNQCSNRSYIFKQQIQDTRLGLNDMATFERGLDQPVLSLMTGFWIHLQALVQHFQLQILSNAYSYCQLLTLWQNKGKLVFNWSWSPRKRWLSSNR